MDTFKDPINPEALPQPWTIKDNMIVQSGGYKGRTPQPPRIWAFLAGAIDTPKEELNQAAQIMGSAHALLHVLKRYEEWEAKLIDEDEAWHGRNFAITDELYEEFMEIQLLRNEAIKLTQL